MDVNDENIPESVEIEREKTKQSRHDVIFWIAFWTLVIGGCTAVDIAKIING